MITKKLVLENKKNFKISIDTFNTDIYFFINYDWEAMLAHTKKHCRPLHCMMLEFQEKEPENNKLDGGEVVARVYPLRRGYVARLTFYKDEYRMNISQASHEISHLVNYILMSRNVPLTYDT